MPASRQAASRSSLAAGILSLRASFRWYWTQKAQPFSCEARILMSSRNSGSMLDFLRACVIAAIAGGKFRRNLLEDFPIEARVGGFGGGHRTSGPHDKERRLNRERVKLRRGRRHVVWRVLRISARRRPRCWQGPSRRAVPDGDTGVAEALARSFAGSDAPLGGKEPDAVGEVPADSDHRDHVDGEHPGVGKLVLDFGKGRCRDFRAD